MHSSLRQEAVSLPSLKKEEPWNLGELQRRGGVYPDYPMEVSIFHSQEKDGGEATERLASYGMSPGSLQQRKTAGGSSAVELDS